MQHKFHLIAAPLVIAVLIAAYVISDKMAATSAITPLTTTSKETLMVSRATWGENCNSLIEASSEEDIQGQQLVEINNVLSNVSGICNGIPKCKFPVNTSSLGDSPVAKRFSCRKHLIVEFRCNKLDVPSQVTAVDGDTAILDCANKPAPITPQAEATN